ncbi:ABC transporter substrate-binding protein [Pseudonocardia oroxyli]|uniref:Peptide/nickel transport system substrate-binding protein n=1 Tax=Pseudonocardia oroxyli TaxID=366584 RepID=A0A1G8CAH1_PSEOR|nr:ABC transporter substrate-binding protein [Pseudonocardia oroxyli]SDH42388.1 peptide/nickel transport system substrate-binding protein [Pseudonocardia oroxyli]
MSIRRAAFGTAAALAAAAVLLSACSSRPSDGAAPSSGEPVTGGRLTYALTTDPLSFNPSGNNAGNDSWTVTRQLFDSLLYLDPNSKQLEPWLAKSWSSNADATEFTFELRDDATFSDGSKVTADDVKATFDDLVANKAKSPGTASFFTGYASTEAVDADTAVVHFSTPNAAFPVNTAGVMLGIVSRSTTTIPYDERATGKGVVGSGPFVLQQYTKDVSTTLVRRPEYAWAPAGFATTGAAHLDAIDFTVVPESTVRSGSLASGSVDVINGVDPTAVGELEGSGEVVTRSTPGYVNGLYFNVSRPATSDLAVRRGIAHAVDATQIRDTAVTDKFTVGTSILSAATPGWADESSSFGFDAAAAGRDLDAAGWVAGPDGIRVKDGNRLSLKVIYMNTSGQTQSAVEVLQQQLRTAGVELTLSGGAAPDFLAKWQSGDFDAAWIAGGASDADILRTVYAKSGTNFYKVDDPQLDELLTRQLGTSDQAARFGLLADVQKRIAEQYYQVPVYENTGLVATTKGVHGVVFGADSRPDLLVGAWKDPA